MNMKDIVESILDGEEATINRAESQIKLIKDLELLEKDILQRSQRLHPGEDMLGNHIEVGDTVLATSSISYWTNKVYIGVILKINEDDYVILSTIAPKNEYSEKLDDGQLHVCVNTSNIIKIHDPKKFIRTKKL